MIGIAILAAAAALILAQFWVIFSARSAAALGVAILGVVVFASVAALCAWDYRDAQRLMDASEYYALETDPPGKHSVRIRAIPRVRGFNVGAVAKGTRDPHGRASMPKVLACGWAFVPPRQRPHLHVPTCTCSDMATELFDSDGDEEFEKAGEVVLSYEVNDETRPTLAAIELQVCGGMFFRKSMYVTRDLDRLFGWVAAGAALLSLIAVFVQVARFRTADAAPGAPPAPR